MPLTEIQRLEARIDTISAQVLNLTTQVAVLSVQDQHMAKKLDQLCIKVDEVIVEVDQIKDLITEAKGGWRVIILIGTVIGAVVGWLMSRADFIFKLFGH